MTENEIRRANIYELLGSIERLHRESGEPVDDLDVYEARQALLRIENALRRQQQNMDAAS